MPASPRKTESLECEEREILLKGLFDLFIPFPTVCSTMNHRVLEREREQLASRAKWNSMAIEELRRIAAPYL